MILKGVKYKNKKKVLKKRKKDDSAYTMNNPFKLNND
jgi:hypothetical protein